jgi:F-type H+-transporting ATPase subunit delta
MRIKLLSKRYAQALFELALENKILDQVEKDIRFIDSVLQSSRDLRIILANVVLDGYKKINVLNRLFEGRVQELTLKFLVLITKKNREEFIVPICKAFLDIYKEYKNIMPVTLTTAYGADTNTRNAILDKLKQVTEKDLEITEHIDESLIGGFKLDFMDFQYDDSVKVQLKRLGKEFQDNLYISKL